jgi:hypothetical protein
MSDPKFITDRYGNEIARKSSNGSTWIISDEVANNLKGTNLNDSSYNSQPYHTTNPNQVVAPATKRDDFQVVGTIIGILAAIFFCVIVWLICKYLLVPWYEEHRIIKYSSDIIGGLLH